MEEKAARPRDPEATKARILSAAAQEFASKGIAGARIDEIAERARTNKRMLYYYFGSKEDLFREVLQRELSARIEHVSQLPGDRIERIVDRQTHHVADRDHVRLLQWESLERGGPGALDDGEREAAMKAWVASVRADQEAGRLSADVDAGQLVLSELALTLFPAAFPQFTRWITGLDVDDPRFLSERRTFLRTFAARFLHVPTAEARAHPLDDCEAPG
ncbi:MAG: TetR/AcrR family transcriptional regulator [Acidimicrobiia bacterium]|nr:TetR/AcrR family transcriptional regulator [Acidimicrobiia bacterium]